MRVQESIFNQYIEDFPRICSDSLPDPTPSVSSTATIELQRSSQATPSADLVIATSATQLALSSTSPNPVTTGPPPSKGYNTSPTTIITLAIMIFLTILTLVLIVVVIILLRNALRKRNQVLKVTEAVPPPPPPPRKPVPVNESHQLQTEPVTVIEEDTRPVHEVLI